jgi:hypothetical protein
MPIDIRTPVVCSFNKHSTGIRQNTLMPIFDTFLMIPSSTAPHPDQ